VARSSGAGAASRRPARRRSSQEVRPSPVTPRAAPGGITTPSSHPPAQSEVRRY
jgi:hypothetical protein